MFSRSPGSLHFYSLITFREKSTNFVPRRYNSLSLSIHLLPLSYTECPTSYRIRYFFNIFTTNEDIATKFDTHYRHIPLNVSHNERTPIQLSLQYLHCC